MRATLVTIFWVGIFLNLAQAQAPKEWVNKKGDKITADLISATETAVKLRLKNGKEYTVPLADLSEESQEQAREWLKEQESDKTDKPEEKKTSSFVDNFSAPWPKSVSTDTSAKVTIVKEDAEKKEFVYHSEHFEFNSDARLSLNVIRKLSRQFEATLEFCKAMPISTQRAHKSKGDKLHRIELFKERADYIKNGGTKDSGGIYMPSRKTVLVPLENVGVIPAGTGFRVDYEYSNKALPHEIVHQLTDRCYSVRGSLGWFTEGLAEYVALTPYSNNGTYKVRSNRESIAAFVTAGGLDKQGGRYLGNKIEMMPLSKWMTLDYEDFTDDATKNYGMGVLVTYYFFHMEGRGDRKNITAFLKALRDGKKGEEALSVLRAGRSWSEMADDIRKGWRSRGVHIEWADESE